MEKYPFKTKPMQHQYDFWLRQRRVKAGAALMDMGTGKTKLIIDQAAYMYDNGWINAMIVFGNKGSYENWEEEINLHLPDHIDRQVGVWRSVQNKETKKKLHELRTCKRMCMKILLINIESLPFKRSFDLAMAFTRYHDTLAVIDESTHIKNPTAKRTKKAFEIRDAAKARRIMTGTAVENRPTDAWAQFEFLRHGCLGHTSYYSFRAEYAILKEMTVRQKGQLRTVKTVVGYRNIEKLKNILAKHSVIIKKEDCTDLPAKVYLRRYVEMTEEQKRLYEEMRKRSIAEIKEAESYSTVKIALTKMLRLHQIVCGYLTDDDGEVHKLPSNRLSAVHDIIQETDEKVIVWANYRANLDEITASLQKEYGKETTLGYYGGTTDEDKARVRKELKRGNEGKLKYLVANPQSGAYGLTLTGANVVVYFSNNFDGELRSQSEDRCHRIGQTKSVTYIDLITRDTVDEKILSVLKGKKSLALALTPSNWEIFI